MTVTMENEKCLFFPHLHREQDDKHKGGSNTPSLKVNWILTAAFKEVSEYKLLSVEVTEPVFYWVYGVEIRSQMKDIWK